jgi:hypothetical protein
MVRFVGACARLRGRAAFFFKEIAVGSDAETCGMSVSIAEWLRRCARCSRADTCGGILAWRRGVFRERSDQGRSVRRRMRRGLLPRTSSRRSRRTRCEVQVAHAIGVAYPVSVLVETFGTHEIDESLIADLVRVRFDLRPAAIIRLFTTSTCAGRSIGRPRPTVTSAVRTSICQGRRRTRRRRYAAAPG